MQSISWIAKEKHWGFPVERFTKYEKSDEPWCRYFGIGRESEVNVMRFIPMACIVSYTPNEITFHGVESAAMRSESSEGDK